MRFDFSKSIGAFGKYLKDFLEQDDWEEYTSTYADAEEENIWESLLAMYKLFRQAATHVAGHFGYEYPSADDHNVMAHLIHIKILPKSAQEMY
ncbi:aminoglycoside 6-adenylyltransferase [Neobacillus niacini]|uniref:aminoglycoside 6-adenylyltransferase n=1 Tax=Neobacillus niacini TaxID=86668 RepID=UPI0037CC71E1